jgi:hypothetical protein
MILLPQITPKTGLAASVQALFANNEQGAWYDPSDSATLFTDAAGTTPVTAVEQPVSLMLDKSRQSTFANRVNLAFFSAQFDNAAWIKLIVSSTNPVTTASTISLPAITAAGQFSAIYQNTAGSSSIGVTYTLSVECRANTAGDVGKTIYLRIAIGAASANALVTLTDTYTRYSVQITAATVNTLSPAIGVFGSTYGGQNSSAVVADIRNAQLEVGSAFTTYQPTTQFPTSWLGNHAYTPSTATASRPVLSARYNLLNATATLATQNVTVTAGSHTLYFTGTGSITLSGTATGSYNAGTHTITTTAGTLTLTVSGSVLTADLRRVNDGVGLPVYQEVTNSTTYDSGASFPRYLRFDGSDDYMLTNSVDFTSTDKVTLWAGVRKLSDGATGIVAELSAARASNNGAWTFLVPGNPVFNQKFSFVSKGTLEGVAAPTSTTYNAPLTAVTSGIGDISGDSAILRINGTQAASSTADQGTGNFGNYPLYIGRRGGTDLPLNGRIFSLIIRGAQSTTQQIEQTETYVNTKTRAF